MHHGIPICVGLSIQVKDIDGAYAIPSMVVSGYEGESVKQLWMLSRMDDADSGIILSIFSQNLSGY